MKRKIFIGLVIVISGLFILNKIADKRFVEGFCTAQYNFDDEIGKMDIFERMYCHQSGCEWDNNRKLKCDIFKIK